MSNYLSCLEILTNYIGFVETNNGEKVTLPDEVEIDSLVVVKNELIQLKDSVRLGDNNDRKDNYQVKSFWSCGYCTYHNPIDSKKCKMCGLTAQVCTVCLYIYYVLNMLCKHVRLIPQ